MEWPTEIPNPEYPMGYEPEDNSIITTFEDGTQQSRRKFTRSRSAWELIWNRMKSKHFRILDNFVKNEIHFKSKTFSWENPEDGETYEVRCMSFKAKLVTVDQWQVEIKLQEA